MKGEKFKDTKCVIRNHIEQGQKFKDQKKKEFVIILGLSW
jgi:hypothetical protein